MAKQHLSIFDDDEEPERSDAPASDASPEKSTEAPAETPAATDAKATGSKTATDTSTGGATAKEPQRKRRGVLFFAVLLLALVFAGVVGVAGYYASQLQRSMSTMQRTQGALPTSVERPPSATAAPEQKNPPINIAIMGTDSRGKGDPGRSDSLMVLHISGDRKTAYFISFPRDMWVDVPGHGKAKINAAYAFGGTALSVQVLETITGTRIDHVATTNFDNFMKLVDVVGGVTVYNKNASKQIGNNGKPVEFPVGEITLNGDLALAYCRQRYDLPNGDFDRAGRQRDVLKAIVQKAAKPEVLSNPAKVAELIGAVGQYVTVDAGMTNQVILDYAAQMRLTGGDGSIKSLQAPLIGQSTSTDGQWIAVYDPAQVAALGKAMREDTMAAYYEPHKLDYAKPLPNVPSPK